MEADTPKTKLFISHASEDKADFVEPLVLALREADFAVWYDKYELTIGDSLLQKISQGLGECDYGVVVLSSAFFRKKWPQAELDGLFALETTERKIILPLWKDVTEDDVKAFSPILAGRLGGSTSNGISSVVNDIRRAVEATERMASFSNTENALTRFKALDSEITGAKRAKALSESREGVALVESAVAELMARLRGMLEQMAMLGQNLQIRIDNAKALGLSFKASHRLSFSLLYDNSIGNAIHGAKLRLILFQYLDPYGDDYNQRRELKNLTFLPELTPQGRLTWESGGERGQFTTEQLEGKILDHIINAFETLAKEARR